MVWLKLPDKVHLAVPMCQQQSSSPAIEHDTYNHSNERAGRPHAESPLHDEGELQPLLRQLIEITTWLPSAPVVVLLSDNSSLLYGSPPLRQQKVSLIANLGQDAGRRSRPTT